ncbi:glycoside hydrolase family 3 N-terminal domain-containing protein [Lyngbya sp. CCY1209]|uniref:glycoside hydrolase family 3 N-terminal domain-containing protein n=1 Tax=Lyngbya sp. CCY1209 TaxID=2886103 RepID=UPI002D216CAC|nr:glycoside hydrolase family 3 N-terminal domain-containing protein [Lyngbya sp. CCY1209]MEB3882959.1 beta-glucosidase [Lyngbya sp. CCY1209]
MELSLAERVAQMVVVRASGHLFDHQIRYPAWEPPCDRLRYWLEELGVGGVIFVDGSAAELAVRTQLLRSWAKIPLLLAADIEEGVGQRFAGATWFPPPMALGAIANRDPEMAERYAEEMGAVTAREALAIGLNWILAPVVDVNNNPDNPVINVRAFGETPETAGRLAAAFIRGSHRYPVLTSAKHFPGHGDTAVDSHIELPTIPHSPERLAAVELPPFKEAIAAGVDSVMGAHLLIPAWDETLPATLSPEILTGKLRKALGFEGLIVTDALVMGAIADRYSLAEASVLAVEAGADILLMPEDPEVTIQAVCEAVESGRISPERIQMSCDRIAYMKKKISPPERQRQFGLEDLSTPAANQTVELILRESVRAGAAVPLQLPPNPGREGWRNLVVADDLLNCPVLGHHTPAIAVPGHRGFTLQLLDRHGRTPPGEDGELSPTLLQLFIRGNPFRGSAGLSEIARIWFKKLLKTGELRALVIYGSPYTLEQFLPEIPSSLPYVFSDAQIPAAQAIALDLLLG